jgi:hypothetical protein
MTSAYVRIRGQFDIYHPLTACLPDEIKIKREDGMKVTYIRENAFASSNWIKYCDEVDASLRALNEAKKILRNYGLCPFIGLTGIFLFIIIFTSVSKSRFLFTMSPISTITIVTAVYCTVVLIILEYRMRIRCGRAWTEVKEICRRYSSNVVQYRLQHKRFDHDCMNSNKYYIVLHTAGGAGFVRHPSESPVMETIAEGEEENSNVNDDSFENNPHLPQTFKPFNSKKLFDLIDDDDDFNDGDDDNDADDNNGNGSGSGSGSGSNLVEIKDNVNVNVVPTVDSDEESVEESDEENQIVSTFRTSASSFKPLSAEIFDIISNSSNGTGSRSGIVSGSGSSESNANNIYNNTEEKKDDYYDDDNDNNDDNNEVVKGQTRIIITSTPTENNHNHHNHHNSKGMMITPTTTAANIPTSTDLDANIDTVTDTDIEMDHEVKTFFNSGGFLTEGFVPIIEEPTSLTDPTVATISVSSNENEKNNNNYDYDQHHQHNKQEEGHKKNKEHKTAQYVSWRTLGNAYVVGAGAGTGTSTNTSNMDADESIDLDF